MAAMEGGLVCLEVVSLWEYYFWTGGLAYDTMEDRIPGEL